MIIWCLFKIHILCLYTRVGWEWSCPPGFLQSGEIPSSSYSHVSFGNLSLRFVMGSFGKENMLAAESSCIRFLARVRVSDDPCPAPTDYLICYFCGADFSGFICGVSFGNAGFGTGWFMFKLSLNGKLVSTFIKISICFWFFCFQYMFLVLFLYI